MPFTSDRPDFESIHRALPYTYHLPHPRLFFSTEDVPSLEDVEALAVQAVNPHLVKGTWTGEVKGYDSGGKLLWTFPPKLAEEEKGSESTDGKPESGEAAEEKDPQPMSPVRALAVLPDGSLLAAWFSAAFETSRDQAILAARKSRHREWSPPRIIASAPDYAVGQPVLLPRPNGELWLFFVVIADPKPPPVDPDFDMLPPSAAWDSAQPYLQRSCDWGVSWDEREHLLENIVIGRAEELRGQ